MITGLSEILPRHNCAWLLDSAFQVAPLTNIQRVSFVNTSSSLQLATTLFYDRTESRARPRYYSIHLRRVNRVSHHIMDTMNEKSHSTPKEERRQSASRHLNLTRLPTLQETLDRRTRPPLDLFCFYVCPISSIMMSFRLGVNALMADLPTKGISGGCTGFLARCPAA